MYVMLSIIELKYLIEPFMAVFIVEDPFGPDCTTQIQS